MLPIFSSTRIRDNWSVPNSSNSFSSANPKTNYNRSISRKTSTQYGVTNKDVFGDPQDEIRQLIANTKMLLPEPRNSGHSSRRNDLEVCSGMKVHQAMTTSEAGQTRLNYCMLLLLFRINLYSFEHIFKLNYVYFFFFFKFFYLNSDKYVTWGVASFARSGGKIKLRGAKVL